jgi:hypothetical protein
MTNDRADSFSVGEIAIICGGILVAAALVVLLTWYLLGVFFPRDMNDPLVRAGGLKPEQNIHVK